MLTCEGYIMFRGVMRIVPKSHGGGLHDFGVESIDMFGEWLYKRDTECWYCNGRSFGKDICTILYDTDTYPKSLKSETPEKYREYLFYSVGGFFQTPQIGFISVDTNGDEQVNLRRHDRTYSLNDFTHFAGLLSESQIYPKG